MELVLPIVIGIGGVTAGGKTSLCKSLFQKLPSVICLHMDDYYHKDHSEQLDYLEEYDKVFANWDSVEAVDFERLVVDLENLLADLRKNGAASSAALTSVGSDVHRHNYSSLIPTTPHISPTVVILDGILIYQYPPLQKYFNLRYFVTLTKEQAFQRRLERRLKLDDCFEPETYFERYAWPSYLQSLHALQAKSSGNDSGSSLTESGNQAESVLFLNGSISLDVNCERILRDLTLRYTIASAELRVV